jgi:glutathione S-transferase
VLRDEPSVARDLARIVEMWQQALGDSGGPFLFGRFGIADAYFAPVGARITTYALPVSGEIRAYVARVFALPATRAWCEAARNEHDFVVEDEPYRTRPMP